MNEPTSIISVCNDLITILKDAGFVNDCMPDDAAAPNTSVFRVGVKTIDLGVGLSHNNADKDSLKSGIAVTYLYPKSGGNPQDSQLKIAADVEEMLRTISKSNLLDKGQRILFGGCQFGSWKGKLRADILFETTYNLT